MISRGTSQQSSAPFNRRLVLDLIRRAGELSRREILEQVALSPQTVANITQELETAGIVVSRRRKIGRSRGQPPIVFALNPSGGLSIGISLEPGSVSGALVNLAGEVLDRGHEDINTNDPEQCLEAMLHMVDRLGAGVHDGSRVWGIGVSLPGPFGAEELSFVGPTTFEGWKDLGLLEELNRRTGYHVCYSTDSIAGALGESLYGAAKSFRNFFYIHIGVGLGGVLVTGTSAWQGANGNATELGHIPIEPGGRSCYCGNRGCLERYVSMHALSEVFERHGLRAPHGSQLERRILEADPVMEAWCEQASGHLRNAICFIENTLDPECIVIGGSAPRTLVDTLIAGGRPWSHSVRGSASDRLRVIPAQHQEESAILGAAVLPIHEMIAPRLDTPQPQEEIEDVTGTLFGRASRPAVGRL